MGIRKAAETRMRCLYNFYERGKVSMDLRFARNERRGNRPTRPAKGSVPDVDVCRAGTRVFAHQERGSEADWLAKSLVENGSVCRRMGTQYGPRSGYGSALGRGLEGTVERGCLRWVTQNREKIEGGFLLQTRPGSTWRGPFHIGSSVE